MIGATEPPSDPRAVPKKQSISMRNHRAPSLGSETTALLDRSGPLAAGYWYWAVQRVPVAPTAPVRVVPIEMRSPAANATEWVTSEHVAAPPAVVIVQVTVVAAPFLRTV